MKIGFISFHKTFKNASSPAGNQCERKKKVGCQREGWETGTRAWDMACMRGGKLLEKGGLQWCKRDGKDA
jgi:hypothetical protein